METFLIGAGCILFLIVSLGGSMIAMRKIGQLWTWWVWHHPDLTFKEFCAAEAALSRKESKEIEERLDRERQNKIGRVRWAHKQLKEENP